MGKVFLILSISLDGYVAGPNDEIEPLHNWLFGGDTPSQHGHGLTLSSASREVLDEALEETGACVAGRRTYDVSGGWGGEPPYPVPYFIVSHDVPPEMAREDAPFTFVTDGVEAAIERAKAAAGDKKVSVAGADVPQQAIRAGLLDEIHIHLVPVLLGEGKRLFDHLGNQRIDLERTRVVEAPESVTHLRFRVKR
jgi:dihydrofolate reductase